ncbi:dna polymerase gamma [Lentinula edodes]|uniref:Mitochondrial DNA polymerase catalytic subunit n=1 Tax=Lentinula edodes TaxID=5353 RepID=A0A1Q3DYA4_LENED|nr:dna polymerase gamma [Lentinula edodes]
MSSEASTSRVCETTKLPGYRRRGLRSLSTLLQIPLLGSRAENRFNIPVAGGLPADILYEVSEYLWSSDLLSLSLTSSHVRALLLPVLYDTVVLKSSRACRTALTMLFERPDICRYIRKLAVRPNYYLAWPKANERLDEDWVVDMLLKIAENMALLHTFDWDGLEMPNDRLWIALRNECPLLKTVYTNIGYQPLNPDSDLFDFTDLTSFSLTVRHSLEETDLFPEQELLPERLWDMLLTKCPNMQDLTLSSFSSSTRLLNVDRLCTAEANWPKLHSLTLGSFGYNDDFELNSPSDDAAFGAFLSKHTELKYLRLSWNFKRWMSPETIPLSLEPTALPQLSTFVGVHQQLAVLPQPALSSIEILDLTCEPLFAGRLDGVGGVCSTLAKLSALTSLDLWLHIPEFKDHSTFFKGLMEACPKLTELHFMCTTSFGVKPLLCLAAHLPLLPHLRTFSLTKGHKYVGDDSSMLRTVLRILRASTKSKSGISSNPNPELRQVNIRWAKEKCPNHLKQEGTYDVVRRWNADHTSVVVAVEVYEKGITALGKVFTRRYRYNNFSTPSRSLSSTPTTISTSTPSASSSSNDTSDDRRSSGRVARGRFRKALMLIQNKKSSSLVDLMYDHHESLSQRCLSNMALPLTAFKYKEEKVVKAKTKDDAQKLRHVKRNAAGVQMLSRSLHEQIFKNCTFPSPPKTYTNISLEHLKTHGLDPTQSSTLPSTDFILPPLQGNNLLEHFHRIGVSSSQPYISFAKQFAEAELPPIPDDWQLQAGWTKYHHSSDGSGYCEHVAFPSHDGKSEIMLAFDVETMPKYHQYPILACAASPNAWYVWISPWILDPSSNSPEHLIPLGPPDVSRLVVGHNVSYDRARIQEEYHLAGTKNRFLDTMSLHVAIKGISSHQRPAWAKYRKEKQDAIESRDEAIEAVIHLLHDVEQQLKGLREAVASGLVDDRGEVQKLVDLQSNLEESLSGLKITQSASSDTNQPDPLLTDADLDDEPSIETSQKRWEDITSGNSLVDVAKLHCDIDISKEIRNDFMTATPLEILESINDYISYCATDVGTTHAVYKKVLPGFLQACPHPVSFAGVATMGSGFLPVNEQWEAYIDRAERVWQNLEGKVRTGLENLARAAIAEYKVTSPDAPVVGPWQDDVWLNQMDWTPKVAGKTRGVYPPGEQPSLLPQQTLRQTHYHPEGCPGKDFLLFSRASMDSAIRERLQRSSPLSFYHSDDEHLANAASYVFYKLPHKDGESANVGSPLAKSFLRFAMDGVLKSSAGDELKELVDVGVKCSYWISARDRILNQMVKWDEKSSDMGFPDIPTNQSPEEFKSQQKELAEVAAALGEEFVETPRAKKWGIIVPQVITMGTVTRRAIERTWLTASNAKKNRVGSELKAMVRAPPGYAIVGADVDSEELWISSCMGDAQFGMHGATAIGWMTLEGTKSAGTDLHSKTASILGISRDQAKVFNYSRIYGAGMRHAMLLLQQGNSNMSQEEAQKLAENLYASTKGKNTHRSDLFGKKFWYGGTESYLFNKLEEIALSDKPQTPALGCGVTHALQKDCLPAGFGSDYMPSRINWVVQSSGVDYLHLLIVSMDYLIQKYDIGARYLISVHDELRYLVKEEDRFRAALALQIANLWTRSMFAYKLGLDDLPQGVAFFSAVDVDGVLRKEVDMTCVTPSQPIPIPPGESLDIGDVLTRTNGGSLWADGRPMESSSAETTLEGSLDGYVEAQCLTHRADNAAFLRAQATSDLGEVKHLAKQFQGKTFEAKLKSVAAGNRNRASKHRKSVPVGDGEGVDWSEIVERLLRSGRELVQ